MRLLLLLSLLLALPATVLRADAGEGSDSVTNVFIHEMGSSSVNVLLLKSGNRYEYNNFNMKRAYHDYGVFSVSHGKITFKSSRKKRDFATVSGKTYFMNSKGLYRSRLKTKKNSVMVSSDDPVYRETWTKNPLTGKMMDPKTGKEIVEVKKKPLSVAQQNAQRAAYAKTYYTNLAGAYGTLYQAVLQKTYCGPDCYTTSVNQQNVPWNFDTTSNALFSNYETVVHESVHHYNSSLCATGTCGYIVEPGLELNAERTAVFPSSEISLFATPEMRSKIFRYNTYVSDSSIVDANVSGIYGLLDEFSAYNNGVRACVLGAQSAMLKGDTAKAAGFISQASGTYFAYYEFNLFMAWYLHAAKLQHPEMYQGFMDNTNLRVTYTLLDASFTETIANLKTISAIVEKKTGTDYLAYNEKTYAEYPKKLLVKEQSWLNNFKVKGVTKGNYFTFLK